MENTNVKQDADNLFECVQYITERKRKYTQSISRRGNTNCYAYWDGNEI